MFSFYLLAVFLFVKKVRREAQSWLAALQSRKHPHQKSDDGQQAKEGREKKEHDGGGGGFELQTAEVAEQGVLEEVKLHMEETFWL